MTHDTDFEFNPDDPEILRDRIIDGIRWLDSIDPTILDQIDLEKLDLSSSCKCVMGQVGHIIDAVVADVEPEPMYASFDEFTEDPEIYGPEYPEQMRPFYMTHREAAERGFFIGSLGVNCTQGDYNRLTGLWAEALTVRGQRS